MNLLPVGSVLVIFFFKISTCLRLPFSKKLCQNGSDETVLIYHYNSTIIGFANVTQRILFDAQFELVCKRYDAANRRFEYAINFLSISTKIKSNLSAINSIKTPTAGRQRKIPVMDSTTSTSSTTTREKIIEIIDSEDKWYQLSKEPVQFFQAENGSVTDVFITKVDNDRKSEDQNIKKSISFLFQTLREFNNNVEDVLEDDDLGQHISQYVIENSTTGYSVKKLVEPKDFIKLQFDSVNFNQIDLHVNQRQFIDREMGKIIKSQGQISTQPIAKQESLPIGVIVKFSLKLVETISRQNLSKPPLERSRYVRFTSDNFTSQHFDNNGNLLNIFKKKLEKFDRMPAINTVFDDIWKNPEKTSHTYDTLKSLLNLESRLYFIKKLTKLEVQSKIFPQFFQHLRLSRKRGKWKVVVRLFDFVSGCYNADLDKAFLDVLLSGELLNPHEYGQKFLNTMAQYQYPSDTLLASLVPLSDTKYWPKSSAISQSVHVFIDISILSTKDSISPKRRLDVLQFIHSKLEPFVNNCSAKRELRQALLDAVATVIVPKMLKNAMTPIRRLIRSLLNMMKSCHFQSPTVPLDALRALRHVLDDKQVQDGMLQTLHEAPCAVRADIVQQLASFASHDFSHANAGSVNARRSWPKHTFTEIDEYLWRSMNGTTDVNVNETASGDFWCNEVVLPLYFSKKSIATLKQRRFVRSREMANDNINRRVRRQTEDTAADGDGGGDAAAADDDGDGGGGDAAAADGDGGGESDDYDYDYDYGDYGDDGDGGLLPGLGGGGFEPNFTPELNCRSWDSIVGETFSPEVYESAAQFDVDSLQFGHKKKHCLFNATFSFGFASAGFKAGFFSGISNSSDSRLYGRTWLGLNFVVNLQIAGVSFSRQQLDGNFFGEVLLEVLDTTYLHEIQYSCNVSINKWDYSTSFTTPAFRIVFSGFAFIMNADLGVGVKLTFWPSHCGGDGTMGIRFQPYLRLDADAYAELENDYFGIGTLATLSLNYYVEFITIMPTGCFYLYHGNDAMVFKFDFYLKLPTFAFINFDPVPIVVKQSYAILTWQFVIKKSSRYVIYGFCFPGLTADPDTPKWEIGDESPGESDIRL